MKLSKTLLAVAGAALVIAVSVASASARQFELSTRDLRTSFPSWEITGAFGAVRCPLTLEIRMHERRITKVVNSLIGFITRAALGACAMGAAQIQLETLPWHLRYDSFTGTLPNITRLNLRIVGMGWNITEPGLGIRCLIRTEALAPARFIFNREAGGTLTSTSLAGEIGAGPECFGAVATIAGTSNTFTVLERLERPRLTLI